MFENTELCTFNLKFIWGYIYYIDRQYTCYFSISYQNNDGKHLHL